MRQKIVAGNWKMNNDLAETEALLEQLKKQVFPEDVRVMIAPSFTNLHHTFESVRQHPIELAAQNMHAATNGAYTGEVSASMLKSVGVQTVILGHSERRAYFQETNELIADKVKAAIEHEMTVIYCFGEELSDRESGDHFKVVKEQLEKGLFDLDSSNWEHIILAYEPVWAIGTGETASPEQAQEMHAFVRKTVEDGFDSSIADKVSILYGGSVKPGNAKEIFAKQDVDGGLIGGAALDAESFMQIINGI
ncbi:MAG: triose-phosphate isomerase [Flavobacteriaceae bacterium]|nr:triose-phosphate isomerase [Flavobacteriaceae bacterium]